MSSAETTEFLTEEWTPDYGNRLFEFDVFISHRRGDESIRLASRLKKLRLKVWHDGDADIAVRRVQDVVSTAFQHSRYFLAFVSATEPASAWTRLEIETALMTEAKAQCERVLVYSESPDIELPLELCGKPQYCPSTIRQLAKKLRYGNRVSKKKYNLTLNQKGLDNRKGHILLARLRKYVARRPNQLSRQYASECRTISDFRVSELSRSDFTCWLSERRGESECSSFLAEVIEELLESDDFSERLMGIASLIERQKRISKSFRALLNALAEWLSSSQDADNRCNAVRILVSEVNSRGQAASVARLQRIARSENDRSVLSLFADLELSTQLCFYSYHGLLLRTKDLAHSYASGKVVLGGRADRAVDLRLTSPRLPVDSLPRRERLWLIEASVTHILDGINKSYEGIPLTWEQRLDLRVSELEFLLEELIEVIVAPLFVGSPDAIDLIEGTLRLYECIVQTSRSCAGDPLLSVRESFWDYFSGPLLLLGTYSERAQEILRETSAVLRERWPNFIEKEAFWKRVGGDDAVFKSSAIHWRRYVSKEAYEIAWKKRFGDC